jgi:hypothetical protein
VSHGVVAKAACFLSHLYIENFRGDGIHIAAYTVDQYQLQTASTRAVVDLPDKGRNQVVVALVGGKLHIRIFDAAEKMVLDRPEPSLIAGATLNRLKDVLSAVPPAGFKEEDRQQIILDALAIAGYALDKPPSSNANLFRVESVDAANNGDSIEVLKKADLVPALERNGRILTVSTAADCKLTPEILAFPYIHEGDLLWLETNDTRPGAFPRGICQVTAASPAGFECQHALELKGNVSASKDFDYRFVIGHGIYTHNEANVGSVSHFNSSGNAGWGVLEDSASGNAYWACHVNAAEQMNLNGKPFSGVGPYRAVQSTANGAVFVACYSEMGGNASEIHDPAVIIGGDYGPGVFGDAGRLWGRRIDHPKARVMLGEGAAMTEIGSIELGSSQFVPGFMPPSYLQLWHGEPPENAPVEDYSLTYSFDNADFFPALAVKPATEGWQRVYSLGRSNDFATLLLTTANTVSRTGRVIPPGKIVFPTGWHTRDGHRFTARQDVPRADNTSSDEHTWECGDRVFRVFDTEDQAPGPEGWICTGNGTLDLIGLAGVQTAAPINKDDVTVKLKKVDGLKTGQYIKTKDGVAVYKIVKITPSDSTIDIAPGASTNIAADEPIKFSPPRFTAFGSVRGIVTIDVTVKTALEESYEMIRLVGSLAAETRITVPSEDGWSACFLDLTTRNGHALKVNAATSPGMADYALSNGQTQRLYVEYDKSVPAYNIRPAGPAV